MRQRVVIVGAGGFLGRNLVKHISCSDYYQIIAITQGADQFRKNTVELPQVMVFSEDALKTGEVVLNMDDLLVNCAYPRAMQGADITIGLDYIEHVFKMAAKAKIKGIINISSQSVYDPKRNLAATEKDTPNLQSIYAVGKYCVEKLLNNICCNIPHTNVRMASLIGPGFDERVPNKMVKYALANKKIVVQDSRQIFGYLDIKDASRGIAKLLQFPIKKWERVYNLGTERGYTLLQIAEVIANILLTQKGIPISVEIISNDYYENSTVDSSLLKRDIGEFCEVSLEDSIRSIVEGKI